MNLLTIFSPEFQEIISLMESKNVSVADIKAMLIARENGSVPESTTDVFNPDNFRLIIDYGKTLKQMIADGQYDYENNDINEKHFPLPAELKGKKNEIDCKLFHFNRAISSEDAVKEMDKTGYRPATLSELLALGVAQPELQRQYPIIALGYVWLDADDNRLVPYLLGSDSERKLLLNFFDSVWHARCRFLGVRK